MKATQPSPPQLPSAHAWGALRRRLRFNKWLTELLDLPMAVLSIVFLGLVVADILLEQGSAADAWVEWATMGVWGLFVLEFLVKLAVAPRLHSFLREHWVETIALLVPAFRMLRIVRVLGRGVVLLRLSVTIRRGARGLARFVQLSHLHYVAGATAVVVLFFATVMFHLEREAARSPFHSFENALWWAAANVTTVACDLNPVTREGRVLAVALMVYGMFVFGYMISIAAAMLQPAAEKLNAGQATTNAARTR